MLASILTGFVLGLPIALVLGLATMVLPAWFTDYVLTPLVGAALLGVPAYAIVGTLHAFLTASRDLRRESAAAEAHHRRVLAQLAAARSPAAPAPSRRYRLGEPG
jgi:hypothetical protein